MDGWKFECLMTNDKWQVSCKTTLSTKRDKSDRWVGRNESIPLLQGAGRLTPRCHPELSLTGQSPGDMYLPVSHCAVSQEQPVNTDAHLYTQREKSTEENRFILSTVIRIIQYTVCIIIMIWFKTTVSSNKIKSCKLMEDHKGTVWYFRK